MRRLLSVLLVCILLLPSSVAFAKEVPLPDPNTEAEITIKGFAWYADYVDTYKALKKTALFFFTSTSFNEYTSYPPHWSIITNPNYLQDSVAGAGGMLWAANGKKICGYTTSGLGLYFILDAENFSLSEYEKEGAVQLYLCEYQITAPDIDKGKCFDEISEKMKNDYGDNPEVGEDFMYWVNPEGAVAGIRRDDRGVHVTFMAPGAEEKLCEAERIIAAK